MRHKILSEPKRPFKIRGLFILILTSKKGTKEGFYKALPLP